MRRVSRRGAWPAGVAILSLLLVAACAEGESQRPPSSALAYPALYTSNHLPEFPGAALVSTGRQTQSLEDGLRLELTTDAAVAAVAEFWDGEMAKGGWQAAPRRVPVETLYAAQFAKGDLSYQITATARPEGGTRIQIVFLRN